MNHRTAVLLALTWLPLAGYVMFRPSLGAFAPYVLLPAVPAVLLLYVMALRRWRGSWVAIAGVTLLCFWLLMAV
jgi:peptide/nickel transport system permease protein